jgi:hypothetical protein
MLTAGFAFCFSSSLALRQGPEKNGIPGKGKKS